MLINPPLPPRLERFVSEQLAAGRFRSEGELVRAALLLLEGAPAPGRPDGRPRRSPRGLLADLRSDIEFEDFQEARAEAWGGLRPGGGS